MRARLTRLSCVNKSQPQYHTAHVENGDPAPHPGAASTLSPPSNTATSFAPPSFRWRSYIRIEPATATLYDAARKPSSETQRWQARTTEGGRPASSDPST
mmetsp:Transcript_36892/g.120618  ORF Transcript_36892/g.120618 Transcript_36892/m.120618 type:complete len:100 (+) Transcript_36892:757-1056(+)|eukprot:CAMPEP_0202737680 /NCGR_PEP_ID=MMETSP1388-20130828/1686_1 /ASSEMBLY_ACC=CAM_ASM_000864 /TAXON_ID=37098 /ORGANISM="Isochrysis sp, Strain CCMP1244" /LENGTH=99 /DNA_ID=CAMNT_0049404231 /DNA_START=147 /DNA_END=446 /DNA_ORIENTATION=-